MYTAAATMTCHVKSLAWQLISIRPALVRVKLKT